MKKSIFLLSLLLFFSNKNFAQCFADIVLSNQSEVDLFDCPMVDGTLRIGGPDITNLAGLNELTSVSGDLIIGTETNPLPLLVNLEGLHNLVSVDGDLSIENNVSLFSIEDFESLTSVGNKIVVKDNPNLLNLEGLEQINSLAFSSTGGIEIIRNNRLVNLNGLQGITSMGGNFVVRENENLLNLNGINNLEDLGGNIIIESNPALNTLEDFENFNLIGGSIRIISNPLLQNLEGFNLVTLIGGELLIQDNISLTNIDQFDLLDNILFGLSIIDNNNLTDIGGWAALEDVGGDFTIANPATTSLTGFENLRNILGTLTISNTELTQIGNFNSLVLIGESLIIDQNEELTQVNGLSSLARIIDNFILSSNSNLTNISGLNQLEFVGRNLEVTQNDRLPSLHDLNNITSDFNQVIINNNEELSECDIPAVCSFLTMAGSPDISINAYGCETPVQVDMDCNGLLDFLTIDCPANLTVNLTGSATQTNVTWTAPTIVSDCPWGYASGTTGPGNGGLFSAGNTVIYEWVSDGCGNIQNCSFIVTVLLPTVGTGDLMLECPTDNQFIAPLGSTELVVNWDEPLVTSGCGGVVLNQTGGLPNGSSFGLGWTCISYEASDACGDMVECLYCFEVVAASSLVADLDNNPNTLNQFLNLESSLSDGNQVLLKWLTPIEMEGLRFVVERSADGQKFYPIQEVTENLERHHFEVRDIAPPLGENYYRISVNDFKGIRYFSAIQKITIRAINDLLIYPNPAQAKVFINLSSFAGNPCEILFCNSMGKIVKTFETESNLGQTLEIDLQDVENGVYYFSVKAEGKKRKTRKVVVARLY